MSIRVRHMPVSLQVYVVNQNSSLCNFKSFTLLMYLLLLGAISTYSQRESGEVLHLGSQTCPTPSLVPRRHTYSGNWGPYTLASIA